METEKMQMTIHRGLAELKLIDARIQKQIEQMIPCGIKQKDKKVNNVTDEADFIKSAKSNYDSILALIERKNKIKCAIVKRNTEVMVTIGEQNMSIADAINYKTLIAVKKQLIASMRKDHKATLANMNKLNDQVNDNCQRVLEVTFGKENVKVTPTDMEAVRKPFMEQNEWTMIDPLDVINRAVTMETELMTFETEVDAVLSEINAITMIEV